MLSNNVDFNITEENWLLKLNSDKKLKKINFTQKLRESFLVKVLMFHVQWSKESLQNCDVTAKKQISEWEKHLKKELRVVWNFDRLDKIVDRLFRHFGRRCRKVVIRSNAFAQTFCRQNFVFSRRWTVLHYVSRKTSF